MLSKSMCHTTLPATDLARARQFYEEKLGLTPVDLSPEWVFYQCADTFFSVDLTANAETGNRTRMAWLVDDLHKVVAELKANGVVFEEYDMPELKTVDGITEDGTAAWFKDSEGNMLAIHTDPRA